MIAEYRRDFNARYTPQKYGRFLQELEDRSGTPVKFRVSETPCFFPRELLRAMADAGAELVQQLVANAQYLAAADAMIPEGFFVARCTERPLFVQADFGIIRGRDGGWEPRLVEIQGFPSLYGFQLTIAQAYRDAYGLDGELTTLLSGVSDVAYRTMLRDAIVGDKDPKAVVLLEIDPWQQKTLPDFLVTEKICGIRTVDIRTVEKVGRRLYYSENGVRQAIDRIYNRAIADELMRRGEPLPFSLTDDLDVEWAGHPNWFFRISKFSLPWLKHDTVPTTWFLDEADELPMAPEQLVLKPLFSFAGLGVTIGPSREEIAAIPRERRRDYILQERVTFAETIETPDGWAKAEVRVMYIWQDELRPVNTIVRMGRGKMMGVDQNRDLEWVGASAGFYSED